jgi:hypothetical protein
MEAKDGKTAFHLDGKSLALIGNASTQAGDCWGRQDDDGPGHFR